jgi:DNA modification methylase
MKENFKIFSGDNLEILKTFADNSIDAVVTDPPYGLGKEPNAEELMKDWIEKGYHEISGTGFMGKEWDAFVPQPLFWKEIFRVLKPGGHVVSFFGTRTYDWGVMAMRFAGFEVRDSLQYMYGVGFPKSYNVAKGIEGKLTIGSANTKEYKLMQGEKSTTQLGTFNKIEKEQGAKPNDCTGTETTINHILTTDEAKQWDGWGSALKPAVEPIVLARKPLEKGLSIADNVLKWGTGGINIDGCRVNTNDNLNGGAYSGGERSNGEWKENSGFKNDKLEFFNQPQGRFPANLILTHHPDCECVGMKKVKPSNGSGKASENGGGFSKGMFGDGTSDKIGGGFTDENGEETIEDWICVDDCPIKIMDEQSGESKSNDTKRNRNTIGSFGMPNDNTPEYNDKGGASRFFYCAKASKSERNAGLEGFDEKSVGTLNSNSSDLDNYGGMSLGGASLKGEHKNPIPRANIHPTVKPVSIMRYLAKLITPPNGIVLDPFLGSGTTGCAVALENFNFIGIERETEYVEIAKARIEYWSKTDIEKLEYERNLKLKEEDNSEKQLDLFE